MKSPHCQLTVRQAVEKKGAVVARVSNGEAEVQLADGVNKAEVMEAIRMAGYDVRESEVQSNEING